jgi:hypothetical protein
VEVGPIERPERLPSERAEVAALRRQVAALESRVRTAERRAELLADSNRTLARVAAWGGARAPGTL